MFWYSNIHENISLWWYCRSVDLLNPNNILLLSLQPSPGKYQFPLAALLTSCIYLVFGARPRVVFNRFRRFIFSFSFLSKQESNFWMKHSEKTWKNHGNKWWVLWGFVATSNRTYTAELQLMAWLFACFNYRIWPAGLSFLAYKTIAHQRWEIPCLVKLE